VAADKAHANRTCDAPAEEAVFSERRDLVPLALTALSGKDRLVTALHYFSAMQVSEIASLLGVPVGTVKSRLHHARQRIRRELEKMSSTYRRPEHVPADFRKVIHNEEGELAWQNVFARGFQGWSLLTPNEEYRPLIAQSAPEHWQLAGEGLVGEHEDAGTCLVAGEDAWRDYELSLLITPLAGGNAQVFFRMNRQARRRYILDMMLGWQAIAVNKLELGVNGQPTLTRLSVVDYPLEHQREYAVNIAARGHSITTYVDGALVNQVTDDFSLNGRIGLNVWQSKTLFRDIRYRLLTNPEEEE